MFPPEIIMLLFELLDDCGGGALRTETKGVRIEGGPG